MGVIATRNRAESVLHALGMVIPTSIAYLLTVFTLSPLQAQNNAMNNTDLQTPTDSSETITLGAGCFWCVEAVFENLKGVHSAVSGYMGGSIKNPSYREVCTGRTGHAEVIKLTFDEQIITYEKILDLFFKMHDPTQKDMQYPDIGSQYRSEIFYENEAQKSKAIKIKNEFNKKHNGKIETNISKIKNYCKAEEYHQNYIEKNKR